MILTYLQRSVHAVLLGKTSRPDWLTCGVPKAALIDRFTVKIMTGEASAAAAVYLCMSCHVVMCVFLSLPLSLTNVPFFLFVHPPPLPLYLTQFILPFFLMLFIPSLHSFLLVHPLVFCFLLLWSRKKHKKGRIFSWLLFLFIKHLVPFLPI